MISILTNEMIQELLSVNPPPWLSLYSLYMPAHRSHPEKMQDTIRLKSSLMTIILRSKRIYIIRKQYED